MPLANPNEIPPLDPLYTIVKIDPINRAITPAEITPNPGPDKQRQIEALDMLAETTGDFYVIMETHQTWGHASRPYTIAQAPKVH